MKLFIWLGNLLIASVTRRPPDFVIGVNYISRWWVIPRNKIFNIYLHQMTGSDDERALHDHPWMNLSIILRGGYNEITPKGTKIRRAGDLILRRSVASHRLHLNLSPTWSLFITGPVVREWGFHCPKGWRHWKDFTAPADRGQIGRGCD